MAELEGIERILRGSRPTILYPSDHKVGMKVTRGGTMCANCEYVDGLNCTNKYFMRWNGGEKIPGRIDEYCCDFWEAQ